VSSYDLHSKVVSTVKQIKLNLGDKLDRLRIMRRHADYFLSHSDREYRQEFRDWPKNYKDAYAIATNIYSHLERLERARG
jgi:hypothetical protein